MKKIALIIAIVGIISACQKADDAVYTPEVVTPSTDPISVYFRENFLEPYGTSVRWQWNDIYVDDTKRVTPALREVCIPMGDFINAFWIEPFNMTTPGKKFMLEHFPPEIVFIGSPMYNSDGASITLGYADAGVRITFTQVNEYDLADTDWVLMQLRTAEHEYGHIIHQRHNLPSGFKLVSPANYKSNNWLNLAGDVQANSPRISREAISLGMTTNYGTSSVEEDFCEVLSMYLTSDEDAFNERYINHEPTEPYPGTDTGGNPITIQPEADAAAMNTGRDLIKIKLDMVKAYYMAKFNIDLVQVRDEIMSRINSLTPAK
ncbi:MAG: hypothetical protein RIS47_566 [Bacteroidota bacterium]|jgi:substrate import-associated zinc metallohydrolase lipoprotein